jgi:exopolysaccharide biosynthesis protein
MKKQEKIFNRKKIIIIVSSIMIFFGAAFILLYSPWDNFRNFWITTAMTTKNHRYLAKWFYSDDVISEVMNKNIIVEADEISNPDLINITNIKKKTFKNKYEKEIYKKNDNDLYKVINIKGDTFRGYLVVIYDSSRVSLATTSYLGEKGELITDIAKEHNATIVMNAGGYYDPNWDSIGGIPHGTVISNKKVVSEYKASDVGGGFVGFTADNKLILGKMSVDDALDMGMRDAVEFGPFLIVNGKKSIIKGNGGWGIAPRSAIGQRKDGIVLFLVIDGRLTTSIGASMSDLIEIMYNYGALNAANMDGGSSSELLIKGKIVNKPVAGGDKGLRAMPTFWVVR